MLRLLMLLALMFLGYSPRVASDDPPRAPFVKSANKTYPQGTVVEVTKDSITVQRPGLAAKKFSASEVLAAGKVPSEPRRTGRPGPPYRVVEEDMYRLTDVCVGDWVVLTYAIVDGVEICDHICIQKRPGGLVPPLPQGVKEPFRIPYHEHMNAYWNLADNGIAYPAHFGPLRRFPVAPPPREVKRDPAPATLPVAKP